MSTLISQDDLKELLNSGVITNGEPDCISGIKYDLRFSGRFLKAKHAREVNVSDFPAGEIENIRVEPGETVFVLTEEILKLPKDIKAELSHKRKLAHQGVLILGGFCVDPLYEGRLMFGIYNFSSEPFPLIARRKLIAIQFYRLSEQECADLLKPETSIDGFPRDITGTIARFSGISNQKLAHEVDRLRTLFEELRGAFDGREEWFQKTGEFIESLGQRVDTLTKLLADERQQREKGEDSLGKLIKDTEKIARDTELKTLGHATILRVINWIGGTVVLVIIGVATFFIIQGIQHSVPVK